MRLLVSVGDVEEAAAALAGGADIIDAKDPLVGALGAVRPRVLRGIRTAVGDARPVTAAIGDASDECAVEAVAHEFASAGATLLKVGFAGIGSGLRLVAKEINVLAAECIHESEVIFFASQGFASSFHAVPAMSR